jgi:flagellin
MSRINTNVNSLIAQRILGDQNARVNSALERLSTGLRINAGRDDPAGLIASETMRAEMSAVKAAQTNISRASNVVAVAESGLSEISNLLNDLESLVDLSANETGLSDEERSANQAEIDMILQSINRIASSTELSGRKLLNGGMSYNTSTVSSANVAYLQLNSARVPSSGTRTVAIDVTQAASVAALSYAGGSLGATPVTIAITGELGTERITLASAAVSAVIAAINQSSELTGVQASGTSTDVKLLSTEYGSDQFVSVRVLSGSFDMGTLGTITAGDNDVIDYGQDVQANINGQSITGSGLDISVRTTTLDANLTLAAAFGEVTTGGTTMFGITGGGAKFAISPQLDMNGLASLGIESVDTTALGDNNLGWLYSIGSGETNDVESGNYGSAQRIVRKAINQISSLRGRLGSFERNTLDTTLNALKIQYENIASAESIVRDADFAEVTATLTRQQILVQSATNVLRAANAQPQQVLALLQ